MMRWLLLVCGCGGADLKTATPALGSADTGIATSVDADGDGVPFGEDCDDAEASVFPGAAERCNGRDDDCDDEVDEGVLLTYYWDEDGDGYGVEPVAACTPPEGAAEQDGDCDDSRADAFPGAAEQCNGMDEDCDDVVDNGVLTSVYVDADRDGWGQAGTLYLDCVGAEGTATQPGDCDDADPFVHPGMPIDACDGVDTDCDGDIDEDSKAGWQLLTVDTNDGWVYALNPVTAAVSQVSPVDVTPGINSMDVSENGVSVVHTFSDGGLAYFDACTGTRTPIGVHGTSGIGGIAFGPGGQLYGIGNNDTLWTFRLTDGQATAVGPLGIDIGNSGLAYDCTHQRMFGADGSGRRIFEIDLSTGQASNIVDVDVPFGSVGLEIDRASGRLWASTGSALYSVDPITGSSVLVGPLAASNVDDLALHPLCP